MRESKIIEKEINSIKSQLGNSNFRYQLACKLHDLNNELGIANKLERRNQE